MRMRHWVIGLTLVGVLASGTLFDASLVSASKHLQPKAPLQMEKKATAPFKVKVKGFEASATGAKAGDTVTLNLTIEYSGGSGTKSVPWRIWRDSDVEIARGQKQVTAGATGTFTVTATWKATAGSHVFYGGIPIPEIPDNVSSRTTMVFTAPKVAAPPAPKLVTQLLSYSASKAAGAQFNHGVDGATTCLYLGQFDGESTTVKFWAECAASPTGGRASPEAFMNFRLKNGWKIKSVDTDPHMVNGDWQWLSKPEEGSRSDNPYMKMRIWANAVGYALVYVKVTIEGPEGTDPYK